MLDQTLEPVSGKAELLRSLTRTRHFVDPHWLAAILKWSTFRVSPVPRHDLTGHIQNLQIASTTIAP